MEINKRRQVWSAKLKKVALAILLFALFVAAIKLAGFAGIAIGFVFFYLFFQLISK